MQYSLLQKDVDALKVELAKRDRENILLSDVANRQQFSIIRADLEKHQRLGHCTKAEVDGWLERIQGAMATSRFSILAPAESPTMIGVFAEIKQMKKVPDGTFLDGKTVPSGGQVTLVPEGQGTSERLSLAAQDQASQQQKEINAAAQKYFEDEVWPQLGIKKEERNGSK
jgi:hypothetical protein